VGNRILRALVAVTLGTALAAAGFLAGPQSAQAADPDDFRAGEIISDSIFFYEDGMTEDEIQAFLVKKVPTCASGYTCLKSYKQDTRSIAADPMCKAYKGAADERASRIIYKVAQACGINPKAILVTLQKEQGLITSTAPGSYKYRSAMGYGCPDTAPCDAEYYGFFNQVYKGAWAFQRYTMPPGTGPGTSYYSVYSRYAAGKTASVQYHPNVSCGSSSVKIKNKATGSLYFYTPYQPNAAALNAGYGLGNSCSAYGNRNFFNYFTDWFGPTLGYVMPAAIEARWKKTGAENGPLGLATGEAGEYDGAGGSGWVQKFDGGAVYDGDATGAYAVIGEIRDTYIDEGSRNGRLGWPTADRVASNANGGGFTQTFQGGVIYASGKGAFVVEGDIREAYLAVGSKSGDLGWPTGAAQHYPEAGGGFVQKFQNGAIYDGDATGAFAVIGDIRDEYIAQGSRAGVLGWPLEVPRESAAAGGGRTQKFQGGVVYASAAGAFAVTGDIRAEYVRSGSKSGELGWPTGGVVASPDAGGGLVQQFSGGTIYAGAATRAVTVTGEVRDAYLELGAQAGVLGWPRGDADPVSSNGGGVVQTFQGGAIYSSRYGAFGVAGELRTAYLAAGSRTGVLGWPRDNAVRTADSGGGLVQRFQGGAIYAGDGVGAFPVTGAVRKFYIEQGSRGGVLGWPTGVAERRTHAGGGTVQSFQGGSVYSSGVSTSIVKGAIQTAYTAAGSTGGVLGWPRESERSQSGNGGGKTQRFAGGAIYSSAAGAFPVTGVIRAEYLDEGSTKGRLGWPTGTVTKNSSGTLTQTFQHGSIRWTKAGGAVVNVDP
jgi:uncharacterized protein with LGFP repeats